MKQQMRIIKYQTMSKFNHSMTKTDTSILNFGY
jgi:hypothetical protein